MKNLSRKSNATDARITPPDSFLARGTIMTGTLKFSGNLTYHGHFKGKIISGGKLIVGETGDIDSEIYVGIALNSGEIKGNITASERVQILPYGKIEGNVKTPDLQIESGAIFNGRSEMPALAPPHLSREAGKSRETGRKKETASTMAKPPGSSMPVHSPKKWRFAPIFALVAILVLFSGIGLVKGNIFSPSEERILENK